MPYFGHPDFDAPEFHLSDVPLGPARKPATKDEVRHIERYLFEPGYAMAVLFLSMQPRSERETRRKAA